MSAPFARQSVSVGAIIDVPAKERATSLGRISRRAFLFRTNLHPAGVYGPGLASRHWH